MNIFSFFSGAGFLDLGFELEGNYNVVYVNEFHKPFNDVYQHSRKKLNLPQPKYGHHIDDITSYLTVDNQNVEELKKYVEESQKETLTGFIGGPPCPDFSVAGKNKGRDGENGKLSDVYSNLICQTLPDFFVFENVKGLYRTARHREFFEELKVKFKDHGYSMTEQLVNALEYGVPQDRDRIILVGFHERVIKQYDIQTEDGKIVDFPWEEHKLFNLSEVKNLPWPTKSPYQQDVETEMPQGLIEELTIMHWWKKNDVENHPNAHMFFQPRAGIARFTTKDEGDDVKKCYKRLHRWRYSPTAAYGNNEVHIHPYKPRRISVSEALAIQSLPKEYELPLSMTLTDSFKTIGNGVPFLLAKGVASTISSFILSHTKQ